MAPDKHWLLQFGRVKFDLHDDLRLVIHLPWGIELWEYDLMRKGYAHTQGKTTETHGYRIAIFSARYLECVKEAWGRHIRRKLEDCGECVAILSWADIEARELLNKKNINM